MKKKQILNYYYNFPDEGIYIIKYKFKILITSTNFMFYDCNSFISFDLSNFNTQLVLNMTYMFYNCNLLKSLDLSNFNTQLVHNMAYMFYNCKLL